MKVAASLLALVASASAHMVMSFPKPYGSPNNSPLDNSGSDFPCKATGPESYVVNEMNVWNAGETKEVTFMGSAVHGGGSCQFSLTTDSAPTKESQWKVIHSVVGGCPANNAGNLPENATNTAGLASYPITLPTDLPAGEYTFAWTWFNKLGNREMYMNCAPIQVGGGDASKAASGDSKDVSSVLGNLPDMFVVNIPSQECSLSYGQDLDFPNPGDSVERASNAEPGSKLEGGGCAAVTAKGAGNGKLGSPSQPTGKPAASESPSGNEPAPTPAPTAVPSNPGGVFAPGASSAAPTGSAAPTATAAPTPSAAPTRTPVYSPPENNSPPPESTTPPKDNTPPSTGAPAGGNGVPCDTDGAIVCIGSSQFGMCNWGIAVPQDLAAGTTCSNGVIAKRSIRFPRAYLHRRHASGVL